MLGARVDPQLYALYQEEAQRLGKAVSDLAREALEAYLGFSRDGEPSIKEALAALSARIQALEDRQGDSRDMTTMTTYDYPVTTPVVTPKCS